MPSTQPCQGVKYSSEWLVVSGWWCVGEGRLYPEPPAARAARTQPNFPFSTNHYPLTTNHCSKGSHATESNTRTLLETCTSRASHPAAPCGRGPRGHPPL